MMLEILHDEKGNIKAVCDYLILNKEKVMDDDGGWLVVEEIEINPEYRNNGIIRLFIKTLLEKHPKIEICSFIRAIKHPDRAMRTYPRKQFELLVKEAKCLNQ